MPWFQSSMGHYRPLFLYVRLFKTFCIKIDNGCWIRTWIVRCQKQVLCQMCHNRMCNDFSSVIPFSWPDFLLLKCSSIPPICTPKNNHKKIVSFDRSSFEKSKIILRVFFVKLEPAKLARQITTNFYFICCLKIAKTEIFSF